MKKGRSIEYYDLENGATGTVGKQYRIQKSGYTEHHNYFLFSFSKGTTTATKFLDFWLSIKSGYGSVQASWEKGPFFDGKIANLSWDINDKTFLSKQEC